MEDTEKGSKHFSAGKTLRKVANNFQQGEEGIETVAERKM